MVVCKPFFVYISLSITRLFQLYNFDKYTNLPFLENVTMEFSNSMQYERYFACFRSKPSSR